MQAKYGSKIVVFNLLYYKVNYLNPKSEANLSEVYNYYFNNTIKPKYNKCNIVNIDLKNLI